MKNLCTVCEENELGWDNNMKMLTCDRVTHVTIHSKNASVLNKKFESYNEMTLVVGQDMLIEISSSDTSKRKKKTPQESIDDDHIQFVGDKLGEIAKTLEIFIEDKAPYFL
ncbi:hypothetical protein GQ457_03G014880 [Hibiscus cannabinus]